MGFEGGAVFSPNGKYVAYYAYRPFGTEQIELFVQMKQYGIMDIARTQLFILNMETDKETLVSFFV
jgi:hypothetical protein